MTLLEMTQNILSDMDSDEVNSISDSTEALQVAEVIKTTYYNIIDGRDFPWLKELFQMSNSGTTVRPTHMTLPENVIDLEWIKYNCIKSGETRNKFKTIKYKTPEEFLDLVNDRVSDNDNVAVISDSTGVELNILTDVAPTYFTSFDDETLVFDSYDSTIESTLVASKTQCYGKRSVVFTMTDSFIPDMPVQMFSYLLSEAKSVAFITLKQMPNSKAEQASVSQKRRLSQEAWRIKNGITYVNFGRK